MLHTHNFVFNFKLSYYWHFRTEERAAGWYRLTREILKLPEAPSVAAKESTDESKDAPPPKPAKDKSQKTRRPQPLIKLVMRRSESSSPTFVDVDSDVLFLERVKESCLCHMG